MMRTTFPIAVVDDDDDDRLMIARAWDSLGYGHELIEFADGDVFLNYMTSDDGTSTNGRPGLVLLDLNMPRIDGWEVLRRLKASAATRAIPVIVLTTSQRSSDVGKTYDLGAAAFVAKPATYTELATTIRHLATFWLDECTVP
jgi:CheY-like chemotaxis protein